MAIKLRKKSVEDALQIIKYDFGTVSDNTIQNINKYIYSYDSIEVLLENELQFWQKKPENKLMYASISTLNIIKLSSLRYQINEFNLEQYKDLHSVIFANLSIAGVLNKKVYTESNYKAGLAVKKCLKNIQMLDEYIKINKALYETLKKPSDNAVVNINKKYLKNIMKENERDILQEISFRLAQIIYGLYQARLFASGNITVILYFIINFLEKNDIPFDTGVFFDYDIKKILTVSIWENDIEILTEIFLSSIRKAYLSIATTGQIRRSSLRDKINRAREERQDCECTEVDESETFEEVD